MKSAEFSRYIIVGPARSGTTVTHLCLAGHPNVSALNDEVKVHPFFTEGISTFTHGNDRETEFKTGFMAIFDALCTLNNREELLACGLKTAIRNLKDAEDFVKSVQAYFPAVIIILTLRNDIVAQYGSLERARITGNWHSWVKSEGRLEGKIILDKDRLHAHAVEYLKTVRELQRLKETHEVFEVFYENDILPDNLQVYYRIFSFLKLPKIEITWLRSKKVAPKPEEFIANYAQHLASMRELRQLFETNPALFVAGPEIRSEKRGFLQRMRQRFFQQ